MIKKCLPVNGPLDEVDILFGDETRAGQKGILARLWTLRGTRPRVVRQQQHLSTYIFGAVCPEKNYGILILDQAGWHTTEKLKLPENLSLLYLPPYSPELNPVEQV